MAKHSITVNCLAAAFLMAAISASVDAQESHSPVIKASPHTTRVVSPLDAEGYVDFVAAFHQELRQGITPQNNAANMFWQLAGAKEPWQGKQQFLASEEFRRLDVHWPPDENLRFLALDEVLHRDMGWPHREANRAKYHKLLDEGPHGSRAPWTLEEAPEWNHWLDAVESQLDFFAAAVQRPRYFSPVYPESPAEVIKEGSGVLEYDVGVGFNPLHYVHGWTEPVEWALRTRAMRSLGANDHAAAMQDLELCAQGAMLFAQSPIDSDIYAAQRLYTAATLARL